MKTKRNSLSAELATAAMSALTPLRAAAEPAGVAGHPVDIPQSAFLQPADLGGIVTQPADPDLRPALRPPQPCHPEGFRGLGARVANEAVTAVYHAPDDPPRPTVLLEDISLYRGSGARGYLRELRRALARTGGCTDAAGTWVLMENGTAGLDSLLIRLDTTVDVEGSLFTQRSYVLVARVRRAVVVLADIGWEVADGHEAVVRALAPTAVCRAATLF